MAEILKDIKVVHFKSMENLFGDWIDKVISLLSLFGSFFVSRTVTFEVFSYNFLRPRKKSSQKGLRSTLGFGVASTKIQDTFGMISFGIKNLGGLQNPQKTGQRTTNPSEFQRKDQIQKSTTYF